MKGEEERKKDQRRRRNIGEITSPAVLTDASGIYGLKTL